MEDAHGVVSVPNVVTPDFGNAFTTVVQASSTEVPQTAKFEKCLKRFADVLLADLPIGIPQTRVTDHAIELESG